MARGKTYIVRVPATTANIGSGFDTLGMSLGLYNVVYSCKYHVVWCPKYRRKVLVNGVDVRLKALIEEVCNDYHIDIIEMEIMPDHVHLLMEVDPQFGIHKAVKQIKGRTSRILRQIGRAHV